MNNKNKIFISYKYPFYSHYFYNSKIFIPYVDTLHPEFDYDIYWLVQLFYNSNKSNIYYFYNFIYKNFFLSDEQKNKLYKIYYEIKKFCNTMNKFIHILSIKYKKKYNNTNLYFNDFGKNKLSLIENNFVYTFDIIELKNIIRRPLSYMEYNIPTILKITNPYTNLKFSLHNIYNIYFHLYYYSKVDNLFYVYFNSNFDSDSLNIDYYINYYINCYKTKYNNFNKSTKMIYIRKMLRLFYNTKSILNLSDDKLFILFHKHTVYFYIYLSLTCINTTVNITNYYKLKFISRLLYVFSQNSALGRTICKIKGNTRIYYVEENIDNIDNI